MGALERLKQLRLSLHSEGGLGYELRVHGNWNETEFGEMVAAAEAALDELGNSTEVPRWLAAFFASDLPDIKQDMLVEAVILSNRGSRSEDEARLYFGEKALVLSRLRARFSEDE